MASPHELFRGKAPIAMGRMGEGIADAYAKAGAIEGAGYQAFGEAIGSALKTAASSYAGYKQQQSQVKAQEKALDTFMPYLPKEMQATIGAQREALNTDPNASLSDKSAYYGQTMSMAGNAMAQHFNMQQIGANQGAATGRTVISENAANLRNTETLGAQASNANLNAWLQMFNSTPLTNAQRGTSTLLQPRRLQLGTQVGGNENIYDEPPR
jgi:hypothetical protein